MVRDERFQISTVARLTGLSVHTIRAWEKRYNVVSPGRTDTHRRLYSREDIRKLTLLKGLVDDGNPIGLIAGLSADQLAGRSNHSAKIANGSANGGSSRTKRNCAVLVVGEALRGIFAAEAGDLDGLEPVAVYGSLQSVPHPPCPRPVDLLVVETPTLFSETIESVSTLLNECGARRAILIYGFGQRETLRQLLGAPRITAIRGPIRAAELRLAASPEIESAQSNLISVATFALEGASALAAIPPRRFSREQLAKLSRISSTVQCECPQHLGKLLSDLTAFEQYSLECENRSPDDARIHAFLHLSTARARALLEEALSRVLESEGIKI
jgi:DNA-binding transcriptional MerR regulator